jgi:GGDEF domain-containing protein
LQSLIDTRNNQENRRYRLSISIGCSYYDPENHFSIDELMASADKLMYEQKQSKKGLLLQGASLSSSNPYPSMHDESKERVGARERSSCRYIPFQIRKYARTG